MWVSASGDDRSRDRRSARDRWAGLRAGNRAIVRAAPQASKAADYLFGFPPTAVNEPETDATDPSSRLRRSSPGGDGSSPPIPPFHPSDIGRACGEILMLRRRRTRQFAREPQAGEYRSSGRARSPRRGTYPNWSTRSRNRTRQASLCASAATMALLWASTDIFFEPQIGQEASCVVRSHASSACK